MLLDESLDDEGFLDSTDSSTKSAPTTRPKSLWARQLVSNIVWLAALPRMPSEYEVNATTHQSNHCIKHKSTQQCTATRMQVSFEEVISILNGRRTRSQGAFSRLQLEYAICIRRHVLVCLCVSIP